jgi:membrane protein
MTRPEQIERDLEASRQRLDATIEELRRGLAPKRMGASLFERTSESRFTYRSALPFLLLGGCVAWSLFANKKTLSDARPQSKQFLAPHWIMAILLAFCASAMAAQKPSKDTLLVPTEPSDIAKYAEQPVGSKGSERGRMAASPIEIPARGWKDILWRSYNNVSAHRLLAIAAGVTFYSLLAIFPAIAALVSLYGLFADAGTVATHLDSLSGLMPGGALDVVRDQMTRVASQGQGTLGLTFAISLITSIWSANAGMKAFFDALNVIYGEDEKRGFFRLNALSLAFTTGAILFLLLALGAVVVLPIVLNFVGVENQINAVLPLLRWPALFVVVSLALAFLYRYGPSRDLAKWHWINWGSAASALVWLAASILFSWYTAHFSTYNATYGSLGAVVGFMVWIWVSVTVFLMGAELDAETEHQTACDTTTGPALPLGRRGATMADTVGAAQTS